MRVRYTARAKGQLKKLPARFRGVVLSTIEDIKREPLFAGDRLKGSRTIFRCKVEGYRIFYRWSQGSTTVLITEIALRTGHTYHRVNPSPHIRN